MERKERRYEGEGRARGEWRKEEEKFERREMEEEVKRSL